MPTKHLIDVPAVAERLGVSVSYVRARVFRREIPFYKLGGAVRFDPDELDAWIDSCRVEVGADP